MSVAVIKNTREHDIDLYVNGLKHTVPAGTYPDRGKPIQPGVLEVETDLLAGSENNPAIKGMIDDGWLIVEGLKPKTDDAAAAAAAAAKAAEEEAAAKAAEEAAKGKGKGKG